VFSTLLGPLPPLTPADAAPQTGPAQLTSILGELAGVGLELLATGAPPSSPDAAPTDVVAAWAAAASATDRPVKQVLIGPYSAGRSGGRTRPSAVAESLRSAVDALAAAGCPFVEIDESGALPIAGDETERRRFADAHRVLMRGGATTHVSLALTGGNFDTAGASTFFDLPYASYAFDLIAGPDNWRLVTAAPGDRGVVCGALDARVGGDESPELLVWAAHYAASSNGRGLERVGLANAPSLAELSWSVAVRKLTRLAEGARIAAIDSPREMASLLDPRAFRQRRERPPSARGGVAAQEAE
jgi:methionine synthase II (cobalamin-independent)